MTRAHGKQNPGDPLDMGASELETYELARQMAGGQRLNTAAAQRRAGMPPPSQRVARPADRLKAMSDEQLAKLEEAISAESARRNSSTWAEESSEEEFQQTLREDSYEAPVGDEAAVEAVVVEHSGGAAAWTPSGDPGRDQYMEQQFGPAGTTAAAESGEES